MDNSITIIFWRVEYAIRVIYTLRPQIDLTNVYRIDRYEVGERNYSLAEGVTKYDALIKLKQVWNMRKQNESPDSFKNALNTLQNAKIFKYNKLNNLRNILDTMLIIDDFEFYKSIL